MAWCLLDTRVPTWGVEKTQKRKKEGPKDRGGGKKNRIGMRARWYPGTRPETRRSLRQASCGLMRFFFFSPWEKLASCVDRPIVGPY